MDISIYENGDGGEFAYSGSDVQLTQGLFNQVYLALFGGNVEQSTAPDMQAPREDWWGNGALLTGGDEVQFNSLTERTLQQVALTSFGLTQIEQAMQADLDYLQAGTEVNASIDEQDRLVLSVQLIEERSEEFLFVWDAARGELIETKII